MKAYCGCQVFWTELAPKAGKPTEGWEASQVLVNLMLRQTKQLERKE
jgi:hypothetical protein